MGLKVCSKCKKEQSIENFNKEQKRSDGFYPWCKSCLSLHRKVRYSKRPRKYSISHKVCSFCKEDKPRTEFNRTSSNNLKPRCKVCEELVEENKKQNKRRCGRCKTWKHLEDFYESRRDGHHSTCIECATSVAKNPSEHEKRRNKSLLKYFGISLQQYYELLDKQNGICPICLEPLDGISHSVDHAHGGIHEGKIRAILHSKCNRFVVGNHTDSFQLRRAADLIENPLTDWIVPEQFTKSRKKKKKNVRRKRKPKVLL